MTDVLIVGAGPSGLALAHELNRRSISFRIIDEKEGPSTHSKALAIQPRTLEIFEKMGVLEPFLDKGLKVDEVVYHWKKKSLSLSLKKIPSPYPFILTLPQAETEQILIQHLPTQIEWKTRLIDIIENRALIERPSGKREIVETKWIVGCDGAHSTIRHLLHLSFKGARFPETFLLADIEADTVPLSSPHFYISRKGFAVLFPFPKPQQLRLIFPLTPQMEKSEVSATLLTDWMKERGFNDPLIIKNILWSSTFQIHRRVTSHFRKENVFLVGDAAHIHSPAGGQGMNTSIQDAFNLGWKLALVIRGVSDQTLLDSYEKERLPIAKQVLKATTLATKFVTFFQKREARLFYWFLRFLFRSQRRVKKIGQMMSEITLHYKTSPLNRTVARDKNWKKGPKPGERAPDCTLSSGTRLYSLLKSPNFVMLLFADHADFAQAMREHYQGLIDVQIVKGEEVKSVYAAQPDTLYLIRPDGYICYRSKSFKKSEVVAYLLTLFKPFQQNN